jgi:hypothetical protein
MAEANNKSDIPNDTVSQDRSFQLNLTVFPPCDDQQREPNARKRPRPVWLLLM